MNGKANDFSKDFTNVFLSFLYFIFLILFSFLKLDGRMCFFLTPFLVFGYLLGYSYLLITISAFFIGTIILSPVDFYLVFLMVCFFFLGVVFFFKLKLNLKFKCLVISFLADVFARYLIVILNREEDLIFPLLLITLNFALSLIMYKIASFVLTSDSEKLDYKSSLFLFSLIFLGLTSSFIEVWNFNLAIVVIPLFLILARRFFDLIMSLALLFISFIICMFFTSLNSEFMAVIYFSLIISFIFDKKYLILISYLIINIIGTYYYLEFNLNYFISLLFISLIYLLVPSLLINYFQEYITNINDLEKHYNNLLSSNKNEIFNNLKSFSSLFELIEKEYQDDGKDRLYRKKEEVLYKSLCAFCHKKDICFNYKKSDLGKILFKGIDGVIDEKERRKVEKECLKPTQFFEMVEYYNKDFYKEYKYQLEYQNLKEALIEVLKGTRMVIDDYNANLKFKFASNLYLRKFIKAKLDREGFDVNYVKVEKGLDSSDVCKLYLKLDDLSKKEELIRIMESIYETSLRIERIKKSSIENYYFVKLRSVCNHEIISGIYQKSSSEEVNGDSYLKVEEKNYYLLALSDGMGSGKKAKEESSFTLKLFYSIIKSGIKLGNCFKMMNYLLKVKNHYQTYATLDSLIIQRHSLKAFFHKNGALHSYLYRDNLNELVKIEALNLPLGYFDMPFDSSFAFKLSKGDIIVMFTDGIKENEKEMLPYLTQIKGYSPSQIAHEIGLKFALKEHKDDVSVLVIKVEK